MADPFREPVALSDPDPRWAAEYAQEAARLATGLTGLGAGVEHIGSTSVPLRGKPVIDIQVAVDESRRAEAVEAVRRLGYRHHGDGGVHGRDYLTSRPSGRAAVNVHVFAAHDPRLADNRVIRDFLRADPGAARAYVAAKNRALRQGHDDLLGYSEAKAEAVAAILAAARRWAHRTRL